MNWYLEPQGFLGTGASLLADVTLLAYILLIVPGMLVGYGFARAKRFRPNHKWTMITITTVNWILIVFLMFVAYGYDVVGNIAEKTSNARYLLPTIHGLLGIPAQLMATYIVWGMLREDRLVKAAKARGETQLERYWFKNAKTKMRVTLALWLITAAFGVGTYLVRYNVVPAFQLRQPNIAPIATEEAPDPTEEATPAATEEAPAATEEAPAATETVGY